MPSVSNANFGPLIAYLVPGVTTLIGVAPFSPVLQNWLAIAPSEGPTIGGFLYLTVAALTAGMTVSAIRWAFVDALHAQLGLRPPRLDFSKLGRNVQAFELLIEIHYRHYQFYANMYVATAIAYVCYCVQRGEFLPLSWLDAAFVVLEIIFFAASRDTLAKYYNRTRQLLSASRSGR